MGDKIITEEDIEFIRSHLRVIEQTGKAQYDHIQQLIGELERERKWSATLSLNLDIAQDDLRRADDEIAKLREERDGLMDGVAMMNGLIEQHVEHIELLEQQVGDAGRLQGIGG